jgi:hypothetical protein
MKKLVMFIIVLTWYGEVLGQTTYALKFWYLCKCKFFKGEGLI